MSTGELAPRVEYPETDGKPLGETDWHIAATFRLRDIFRRRYRGRRVYSACNLLLYYVEGEPTKFIVPDNFVVLDCDPRPPPDFSNLARRPHAGRRF